MCVLGSGYLPVKVSTISATKILEYDLYQEMGGKPQLYKSKSFPLMKLDLMSLNRNGCELLYIPVSQKSKYIESLSQDLPNIINDDSILVSTKMGMMTQISESILSDVLNDPGSRESIRLAVSQCEHHVTFSRSGEDAQSSLLKSKSNAPFPIAHALTVSNFSIMLGMRCGIDSADEMHGLGVGALLHEIGKTLIDRNYYTRIENKIRISNTRLRMYPKIGMDMLRKTGVVPKIALKPIIEHQERIDGTGYPSKLKGRRISTMGKIVAICDAYDESMHPLGESTRPTPFGVLKKMRASQGKFDEDILIEFIKLLGNDFQ